MRGDYLFKLFAEEPSFAKMHPKVASFLKNYMSNEKLIKFRDKYVVNTQFPPYPSRSFNNLVEHFNQIGDTADRKLYSVTLAVTNRCGYRCWHCYNAGRNQTDISFEDLKRTAAELKSFSTVSLTLTGGEPLLRKDLEDIARLFDDRTSINLNTTGDGLTPERAERLRDSGIFAVGVSLDSINPETHDRLRGRKGAFTTAVKALEYASQKGLYPYIIAVASHDFLQPDNFYKFFEFAAKIGALEVHLLEPCPTGKLAGKSEVTLSKSEKTQILNYQKDIAGREDLPILSTFLYLEAPESFGCGAGITHMYIDGSGEVCPCNLVPISFGNISHEPLSKVLSRMSEFFCRPRTVCVGHTLAKHIPCDNPPTSLDTTVDICRKYLPAEHPIPRFFQIRNEARDSVGTKELKSAYDRIHNYYEEYWVSKAGQPVIEMIDILRLRGDEGVFEAGCGTGFATCLLAEKLNKSADITAADISPGMQEEAVKRAQSKNISNIQFVVGDALKYLNDKKKYDLIFSSWVLGYIPLSEFFSTAGNALHKDGQLAFIVHKENSPYEQLQIYWELVSQDPSVLLKQVAFDFPRDAGHVRSLIESAGLEVKNLWEGQIVFQYDTPEEVMEHLLKSGAGTAFHDAIDPNRRDALEKQFISIQGKKKAGSKYEVAHDYISCIAGKP